MLAAPNSVTNNLTGLPHSDSAAQTPIYAPVKTMPMFEATPPVMPGNRTENSIMPQSYQVPEKMAFAQAQVKQMPAGVDFPKIQEEADFLEMYLNQMMA